MSLRRPFAVAWVLPLYLSPDEYLEGQCIGDFLEIQLPPVIALPDRVLVRRQTTLTEFGFVPKRRRV